MNLVDVDDEDGLQQDEYSQSGIKFGKDGQLEVVGWSGRQGSHNLYIVKCSKCSQDSELFGEGLFRSLKGALVKGRIPCGCSKKPLWTQMQYATLCSRKAAELGYTFLGFVGEWKGHTTKIKMSCEKHGQWSSGIIHSLINNGVGCLGCQVDAIRESNTKPDNIMIASFFASGSFNPDTVFHRSGRLNSLGYTYYWYMTCPECGETGESISSNLQLGRRPCACSKQRQKECYINWVIDEHNNVVGIKFGIARDSKERIKNQNRLSAYEVRQYQVYTFPSVQQCKEAERVCKEELETAIILKRDMPDGYTETTWPYNLAKVKSIYERHGGILV